MDLKLLMYLTAITLGAAGCQPDTDTSEQADIVTDIDSSADPRSTPFIYYVEGVDAIRGECEAGASLVRAKCQNNRKAMKLDIFEKRVGMEVNAEIRRIEDQIKASEETVAKAKDSANALLIANHDLQKKLEDLQSKLSGDGGNEALQAGKQVELSGLNDQLTATDAALVGTTGATQQQLLAIKNKILAQIALVKKDLDVLKVEHASLVKQVETNEKAIAENSKSIDNLIDQQNSGQTQIADLNSALKVQVTDLDGLASTMKLLTADLIPYTINSSDTGSEQNKRWIKRFDLVMSGLAGEPITVGPSAPLANQTNLSAGYMLFHRVTVSTKMDVSKLGVVVKSAVPQAHMTLYRADTKQLILSTASVALAVGTNEIPAILNTVIEPGDYLIGIQANSSISVGQSNAVAGVNFTSQIVFPNVPATLQTLSSAVSGQLNLYMIGDKY